MSSKDNKKKGAGRAHAVAAWEWFKEAAWLQVLLIVGLVVGVVVAIPYAVKGISGRVNNSKSTFFSSHAITYEQLNKKLDGTDKSGKAVGEDKNSFSVSDDKDGFVVLFYKDNCDGCDSMQSHVETWFNNFNKKNAQIEFYSVNVSWKPGDTDECNKNQGQYALYDNSNITLEEQRDVQNAIRDVYLDNDENHKNSEVTEEKLKADLTAEKDGGTLPTPFFVTFTKAKSAANYITDVDGYNADKAAGKKNTAFIRSTPSRAIVTPFASLSLTSATYVASMRLDIYGFQRYVK